MKRISVLIAVLFVLSLSCVSANDATPNIIARTSSSQNNFNGKAQMAALKMTAGSNYEVAIQFSLAADALYIGVTTPSYSNNIGSMTFSLYHYDAGFMNSKSKEPIITHTFEDFNDNAYLGFSFENSKPLKAGEYVLVLSEPYDATSGVGVWAHEPYDGQYVFINEEYDPQYSVAMHVDFITEPADGIFYGKLSDLNDSPTSAPATATPEGTSATDETAVPSATPKITKAATATPAKGPEEETDPPYVAIIVISALVITGAVIGFVIVKKKKR